MDYGCIVIGAGFSGATIAREFAEKLNTKVLLIEKRSHIGGNMYDSADTNGVSVHWYGPHIFHTNDDEVFQYLKRFSNWYNYEHRVLGRIDGQLVPIPFNFKSVDLLFPKDHAETIKAKLISFFPAQEKVSILDLVNHIDLEIKEFGQYVFEKVFLHYTAKQWGTAPENVDKSVINRVPVVLGYDDRYFHDKNQFMPEHGYTRIFENMLNHPNITLRLNCNATDAIQLDTEKRQIYFEGNLYTGQLIFTGAIDELFGYLYGPLPYRTLDLVFEQKDCTHYQPAAVVNYPNEEDFTRITEFKHLTLQHIPNTTTILKEYPMSYDPKAEKGNIPYYVIENQDNRTLYNRYAELAGSFKNLHLCGRLADYKYYNMDAAVKMALELVSKIQ